jgi:hypothetical protein
MYILQITHEWKLSCCGMMPMEKILQKETSPTATNHNKLQMNCLWSKSRSPRWKTSKWVAEMWHRPGWLYHQWSCGTGLAGCITSGVVAQTWLTVSSVGLWHRLGWLYHQWRCGTDLADCITSGAVAQTWLVVLPVELGQRPGWFYHQWVVHIQNINRIQI